MKREDMGFEEQIKLSEQEEQLKLRMETVRKAIRKFQERMEREKARKWFKDEEKAAISEGRSLQTISGKELVIHALPVEERKATLRAKARREKAEKKKKKDSDDEEDMSRSTTGMY